MAKTIMIVDDSASLRQVVGITLKAAGAKAWMVKPFQPAQMLNAVSRLVMPTGRYARRAAVVKITKNAGEDLASAVKAAVRANLKCLVQSSGIPGSATMLSTAAILASGGDCNDGGLT